MEIKTITLPTRKIEVEVYAPAQTSEKVPAILLLHELFGILDVYREDAQDLANRGYLVYVPIYLVVVQSSIVFGQWSVRLGESMLPIAI